MVVSYVGGSWTDKLAVRRYGLSFEGEGLVVTLEVAVRPQNAKNGGPAALREFVKNCQRVESILIGKQSFVEELRERARLVDNAEIGVHLSAAGQDVRYPAAVTFGPDAVTLHLG